MLRISTINHAKFIFNTIDYFFVFYEIRWFFYNNIPQFFVNHFQESFFAPFWNNDSF